MNKAKKLLMNIGIDIRSTVKTKTGIGYYTINLINALAKVDRENNYLLYSKISPFNKKKKLPPLPGANFKHRINRLGLNPAFILKDLDIFHTSTLNFSKPKHTKIVLVIHGVIHKAYPAALTPQTIKDKEENLKLVLPKVSKIIVPSLTTKKDLLKFYKVDESKIRVIYSGVNKDLFSLSEMPLKAKEKILKEKYNITMPFILYAGTLEPRKNINGLIKAFKLLKDNFKLKHKLVIAGMKGLYADKTILLAQELGLKNEVIFAGYVERDDLRVFYEYADVFAFPSFYEGFGLPVLEAFAFRVPVVTSKTSSLGEIAGEGAFLVDPYEPQEISQAVFNIINDVNLRNTLIEKGLQRLSHFSWEIAAQKTRNVFYECREEAVV